jgi:hypothetical protein
MTGGGKPGACTRARGYLAQFEIQRQIGQGILPHYDNVSDTYWYNRVCLPFVFSLVFIAYR